MIGLSLPRFLIGQFIYRCNPPLEVVRRKSKVVSPEKKKIYYESMYFLAIRIEKKEKRGQPKIIGFSYSHSQCFSDRNRNRNRGFAPASLPSSVSVSAHST